MIYLVLPVQCYKINPTLQDFAGKISAALKIKSRRGIDFLE